MVFCCVFLGYDKNNTLIIFGDFVSHIFYDYFLFINRADANSPTQMDQCRLSRHSACGYAELATKQKIFMNVSLQYTVTNTSS